MPSHGTHGVYLTLAGQRLLIDQSTHLMDAYWRGRQDDEPLIDYTRKAIQHSRDRLVESRSCAPLLEQQTPPL